MAELNAMQNLLNFLRMLDEAKIHFALERIREGAIMVCIAVPGEHWEVEFFADGAVEVEVFRSPGHIEDESAFERLFRDFSV